MCCVNLDMAACSYMSCCWVEPWHGLLFYVRGGRRDGCGATHEALRRLEPQECVCLSWRTDAVRLYSVQRVTPEDTTGARSAVCGPCSTW